MAIDLGKDAPEITVEIESAVFRAELETMDAPQLMINTAVEGFKAGYLIGCKRAAQFAIDMLIEELYEGNTDGN